MSFKLLLLPIHTKWGGGILWVILFVHERFNSIDLCVSNFIVIDDSRFLPVCMAVFSNPRSWSTLNSQEIVAEIISHRWLQNPSFLPTARSFFLHPIPFTSFKSQLVYFATSICFVIRYAAMKRCTRLIAMESFLCIFPFFLSLTGSCGEFHIISMNIRATVILWIVSIFHAFCTRCLTSCSTFVKRGLYILMEIFQISLELVQCSRIVHE